MLARHGETDWNHEGRVQDRAPVPLNDRGRRQAALGEHLAETYDVDSVVASDLLRTRETAALLAEAGLPAAAFDAAWRERDFGTLQGLRGDSLFDRHPEFDADSGVVALEARPPGGESLVDLHERVVDAWQTLPDSGGGTMLVVTHGGPLHVLHGHVAGEDLATAFAEHSHDNCAVSELLVGEDAEVVCENECGWTLSDG